MAPVPAPKGSASHPGHIPLIAAKIAELKGVDLDTVLKQTRINTKVMYNI